MFSSLLNQKMDVRSRAITVDPYGGQSVTSSIVYASRMCRIDTLTNEQQALLSRSGIMATHKFFCEGDMSIAVENDLIVDGKTYRVVSVIDTNAMSAAVHHLTVLTRTPA